MRVDGERAMGVGAAFLGLFVIAETLRLREGLVTAGGPGTRFLPLVLGSIVAVLGAVVALGPSRTVAAKAPGDWAGRARGVGTLAGLVGYALVFERLGYVLSTIAFLTLLLLGFGERRWFVVAAVALGATAGTYAVFAGWLKVPLPPGLLDR